MQQRVLLALCLMVAVALAQNNYGNAPTTVDMKSGSQQSAGSVGVSSYLTAEDRRFAIALNWLRQDPVTFKAFMVAQGIWDIQEPFLQPTGSGFQPNYALHYNAQIAGAAHFHVYDEATHSVNPRLPYDESLMCPDPSESSCAPPAQYGNGAVKDVECFRYRDCTDATQDYYNRLDRYNIPIVPLEDATVAGGEFFAGGTIYTNDNERQVKAAMSIVCDSGDPTRPFNCTADSFGGQAFDTAKEILYSARLGLRIQGTGYYFQGNTAQANYFDTYFAAGPAPSTNNPIASGGFVVINGNGYFVLNYRDVGNDRGVPNQVGVIYEATAGASTPTTAALGHAASAALVYTLSVGNIRSLCTAGVTLEYCLWAADSSGNVWRYPENANLNICAGFGASDTDLVSDSSAAVDASGGVVFKSNAQTVPKDADTDANGNNPLAPSVPFGGSAAAVLPAIALVMAALFAMLSL